VNPSVRGIVLVNTVRPLCRYDTIGKMRWVALFALLPIALQASAQNVPESYVIYTESPRLFLRPQRLRLVKRERERKSLRWDQFERLMAGQVPMPEPGFADALYYRIAANTEAGKRAVAWAAGPATDIRQIALVFDWCQDLLSAPDRKAIVAKLSAALALVTKPRIATMRDQTLAAIALAADAPELSQRSLKRVIEEQWNAGIAAALRRGEPAVQREEAEALWEMFHAVRDNLNVDLRESASAYFKEFPVYHLLSHYPAPFPAAENEYRIPASKSGGPDLHAAALSRAAELGMVALDSNAPESQVLQGWLMNDRFLMRGAFGIPYEMLWANPYQPGLSYYLVPLTFHDDASGTLFIRSSWEDDAIWVGLFDKQMQIFRNGAISSVNPGTLKEPLELEEALVLGKTTRKFQAPGKALNDVFIVGLQPKAPYHVEVEDEEMTEISSDVAGSLYVKGLRPGVEVRLEPRQPLQ
jgi:hypothetical protein